MMGPEKLSEIHARISAAIRAQGEDPAAWVARLQKQAKSEKSASKREVLAYLNNFLKSPKRTVRNKRNRSKV